jgi:amino acid adenylation domain-containing protein
MGDARRALWSGFIRSAEQFGDRTAVVVEGASLSYRQLNEAATRIAANIQAHQDRRWMPLTAILAHRSATAFAGVLGALLAGNGYVPLNRTFPVSRTKMMFSLSKCRSIVVDTESMSQLEALLDGNKESLLVIMPDQRDLRAYRDRWTRHIFLGSNELKSLDAWRQPRVEPDSVAYLLFTSGSTGVPKGVMVAHRNVLAFLDYMTNRFAVTELDIVSQMFDLTFDLSAFDMFVAWQHGATVCCPSQKALINPAQFIRDRRLTVWFSVPSTVAFMNQLGTLKPRSFPSLRLSLFCGEPLPVSSAESWLAAAHNSALENLYGPTELTIACTAYKWHAESRHEAEFGIVPIGYPYPGMNYLVVDERLNEVGPGKEGELLMNGPQMSLGYWQDIEKTRSAFVVPPGHRDAYYRTGDRVRRPVGQQPLCHLGRMDWQVKIRGHRVEMGEVEEMVRQASGRDGVVAIGWPTTESGYGGIEVFIEGNAQDVDPLRASIAARLPDYMVPRRFHFMGRLPRNVNAKFDRQAMASMLGEGL